MVRTTVDLPADVHQRAASVARDRRQSLSRTLAELIESALSPAGEVKPEVELDATLGLPVVRVGRPITTDDVRALDDE